MTRQRYPPPPRFPETHMDAFVTVFAVALFVLTAYILIRVTWERSPE